MYPKYLPAFLILTFFSFQLFAQYDAPLYASYTTKAARDKMYHNIIANTINKNLSFTLNDETEEKWEEAFTAMEVMLYKTPFTDSKILSALDSINQRSVHFQRSLVQLLYAIYPNEFHDKVYQFLLSTTDTKLFASCAEYLMISKKDTSLIENLSNLIIEKFADSAISDPVLYMLQLHMSEVKKGNAGISKNNLKLIFSENFLPGKIVMYSIQRSDRNYPGMVIIRNAQGKFITDSSGSVFHIPQLARSNTNMPGYLFQGNTPQGIFLMNGFGVSMSSFIGPSANVQMSMPFETSVKKFLGDSSISDTLWKVDYYNRLIPAPLRNHLPLYYSYYSGQAGRREIIAHGTTVDPKYYLNQPYYPLTPSQGCLCAREVWNGKRMESDQQKLVNGLLKAGGANGYCLVIEIDNKKAPVEIRDISPYLNAR
ncbi:MAG: hypothetical protein ABIO82_01115 [Ginsengibacter sp.]